MELNACAADQHKKADDHLNAVYRKLVGILQNELEDARSHKDLEQAKYARSAIDKLKATEKAWLQYRDLHCDAARHQNMGGSMDPMIWANCMEAITNHRIDELKSAY